VQRYREKNKRIDYVPSPNALAVIQATADRGTDKCMASIIDRLIVAGGAAISGNALGRG